MNIVIKYYKNNMMYILMKIRVVRLRIFLIVKYKITFVLFI